MIAFFENGNIFCTSDESLVPRDAISINVPDRTSPFDLVYDGMKLRLKNESEKEADHIEKEKEEAKQALAQSDMPTIRVIEDIIDILLAKNILKKSDLPQAVQSKIDERKALREKIK